MTPTLRELLDREHNGVLATLSARRQGWPFASIAPYALTTAGEPLLLFSDLAEHTRNVRADPRSSLLVQDSSALDDPQVTTCTCLTIMAAASRDVIWSGTNGAIGRRS